MDLFKLVHKFVKIHTWISLRCFMDLSNFKFHAWISLSYYMDLSKLLQGYFKVVKGRSQKKYTDLSKLFFICISRPLTNKPSWSLIKISKLVEASAIY